METLLSAQFQAFLHRLLSRKVRPDGFNCTHQISQISSLETQGKMYHSTNLPSGIYISACFKILTSFQFVLLCL